MNKFFDNFSIALKQGDFKQLKIKPANGADIERVMNHYRYQFSSKVEDSLADTFVVLKEKLAERWKIVVEDFLKSCLDSPRSLNLVPAQFLNWLKENDKLSFQEKELAIFENEIDIFSWTHMTGEPASLNGLDENSVLELYPYKKLNFETDVYSYYHNENPKGVLPLILWQTESGVYFRRVEEWQFQLLKDLQTLGLGASIERCRFIEPADLQAFFVWLGQSGLVKSISSLSQVPS